MKTTTLSIEEWQKIVNQFKNQKSDSTEFCQVTLEWTKVTKSCPARDVTFNIGLNTITVSATEKELIIALAKELIALC